MLSDTLKQVLFDTKALNEIVPWITYLLNLDLKMKRRYKTTTSFGGTGSNHVLFEKPRLSRKVKKPCRGCYEVISSNESSALAAAKARRVRTMYNKCEGKVYFWPSRFKKKLTLGGIMLDFDLKEIFINGEWRIQQ